MVRVRTTSWFAVLVGLVSATAQASAPPATEHVRGDVLSRSGEVLKVKSRSGETLTLKLAEDVRVNRVEKADLSAVDKGAFVGTTALSEPNGTLRAVEVHVFPDSMRGTGEGHRPWDLGGSRSTMTNGTVSGVAKESGRGGTMTNATVSEVQRGSTGETLSLAYHGGSQRVLVPPGTTVVKIEPGDPAQLAPGAHVFVSVTRARDGARIARGVVVGTDVVPPM